MKGCEKNFFFLFQKTYETVTGRDPLLPNLFLTAIDMLHPGLLEQASRELWLSAWSKVSHVLLFWLPFAGFCSNV